MRPGMRSCHISVSIDGALSRAKSGARGKREVLGLFDRAHWPTLEAELYKMKADGYEVVPFDDCDNQASTGRCMGHKELA
jgi:hypothetical protein